MRKTLLDQLKDSLKLTSYSLPEPSRRDTSTSKSVYSSGLSSLDDLKSRSDVDLLVESLAWSTMRLALSDCVRSLVGRTADLTSLRGMIILAHRGGGGGGRGPLGRRGEAEEDWKLKGIVRDSDRDEAVSD